MTDQGPTAGPLRLGTRGSLLARTQSQLVADSITAATGRAVELVIVRTEGDDVSIPLDAPSRPGALVVNSPMISSMMSSSVTRPRTSPYSSMTSPMRWRFSWKNWSWRNTGVPPGTK